VYIIPAALPAALKVLPHRRTFHPGVHDRSAATIINVRAGEQINDADIWLQQQFAPQ
jgi:hypothetical protein